VNKENWDKLDQSITEIKITLARNTVALEDHIRRTELAEQNIDLIRKEREEESAALRAELEPIKDHVKGVNLILKLIGTVGASIGATLLFIKEFGLFKLFQ